LLVPATVEPGGYTLAFAESWEFNDSQGRHDRSQVLRYPGHVLSTLFVVVGQQHDTSTLEKLLEVLWPFLGTLRVRRGDDPFGSEFIDAFFALHKEYSVVIGNGLEQPWQAIRNIANPVDAALPSAIRVTKLTKLRRSIAAIETPHLSERFPIFVIVGIRHFDWFVVSLMALFRSIRT
jgi:hypothetical protein